MSLQFNLLINFQPSSFNFLTFYSPLIHLLSQRLASPLLSIIHFFIGTMSQHSCSYALINGICLYIATKVIHRECQEYYNCLELIRIFTGYVRIDKQIRYT